MNSADVQLVIRRTVQAPISEVYRAWTDPALMQRWFAPGEMTASVEADVRPGGHYRIAMREPDGTTHTVVGIYERIDMNTRLIFTWRWEGGDDDTRVQVDFVSAADGETELTIVHSGFHAVATRAQHQQGWKRCLDKLDATVCSSGMAL